MRFGEQLGEQANFQSFGGAVLLLIRASTGEAWNSIMYDLMADGEGCRDDPPFDRATCGFSGVPAFLADSGAPCTPLDGCGSMAAAPFFVVFEVKGTRRR